MATASSLCNFLSFLLPTQLTQTKKPPNQLAPLSTSDSLPILSTSTSSRKNKDGLVPLMENDGSGSSSKDLMSVVCPSLAYSNTLFFKSAYNVQVIVGEDEPEEVLLRRFRREVMKAGVIQECKRRRFFENTQEEKKRRVRDAAKRNKRRRPYRPPVPDKLEASKTKSDDDDQDNWDLPAGGNMPY
ncbi:30S ribosomal protein S21 protein [Thalictrum thalictroides]|uniref:30S ribosomal protein S21 protein n=1 Tax=Thalictrum thalictroides TaxID=46969 RepID=A0A7J6VHN2_THATH|nr:30S ribosomal protein S21 protein [Thalictrum thalictroides]